ncbi:demethylmenaquinone methyltransferase [Niabella terrae]
MEQKSTIAEIRARFDGDVERFSHLDTGQVSTIDARLSLELITESAKRLVPGARTVLDIGCGAGNYTLMMLSKLPDLDCSLADLSGPMLQKAQERVSAATRGHVDILQGDIRDLELPEQHFDIILAGAVLHHLRDDADWEAVFAKCYRLLKPGGCLMISDLVTQETELLTAYSWEQYGAYLEDIGGQDYREKVLAYIEKEDSPRPVTYQLELMKKTGFTKTELLHKHMCFAAFGAVK